MVTTTLEQETEREQEQTARNPETVEQLAYRFWQERGCPAGSPDEDWYRAERELKG